MTEARFAESMAAWIIRRREERGFTQLAVALALGVKRSTVSAWERGERNVSAFQHARLQQLFESGSAGGKSHAGR